MALYPEGVFPDDVKLSPYMLAVGYADRIRALDNVVNHVR